MDLCTACDSPMHFQCGGMSDEDTTSICEECCIIIGDVDDIHGRWARRRELVHRLGPIYNTLFEE